MGFLMDTGILFLRRRIATPVHLAEGFRNRKTVTCP